MENKKNKNNQNNIKLIGLIVFSFIIGGLSTVAIIKWTPIMEEVIDTENLVTRNDTQVYEKSSLAPAVEKIYDATMVVKAYSNGQYISTGTGFVYKTDDNYGYLLTNQHVVTGSDEVKLVTSTGEEIEATLLGGDEYLDLAVLQIKREDVTQVANIGSSEEMQIGDTIFTVGAPLGEEYRGTVTAGILSGKDRMVSVNVTNSASNDWIMRVLQLDASINPGNSGGPLLNVNGEVIGVSSLKLVDDDIEGMGFAIPIEYAMSHIEELEAGKEIEWPLIGISMANVTDSASVAGNGLEVPEGVEEGVIIADISADSAADNSELQKGDVIIALNDKEVKDTAYLRYELYQHKAGDTIEITYIRDGKEQKTKVTLGKSSE